MYIFKFDAMHWIFVANPRVTTRIHCTASDNRCIENNPMQGIVVLSHASCLCVVSGTPYIGSDALYKSFNWKKFEKNKKPCIFN